jgi:hypothetical protein
VAQTNYMAALAEDSQALEAYVQKTAREQEEAWHRHVEEMRSPDPYHKEMLEAKRSSEEFQQELREWKTEWEKESQQAERKYRLEMERLTEATQFQLHLPEKNFKLEQQRLLDQQAFMAREVERQRQMLQNKLNREQNKAQQQEKRRLKRQAPPSSQPTLIPLEPASPVTPTKPHHDSPRDGGEKFPFQPSILQPSVSRHAAPTHSPKARKLIRSIDRSKKHQLCIPSEPTPHHTQRTPAHSKVRTKNFPPTTISNQSPGFHPSPTHQPPSNTLHHSWFEPVHRKALRQQPFLDIVNYWFPLGIPRAKWHRGNQSMSGSTTLPLSSYAPLLHFALPPRVH